MGAARRRVPWLGIVGAALALALPVARGGVLLSQEEALALAFPDAEIESETVVLTEAQLAAVQAASGARLESKLFRYFTARRAGVVVGYGVIDTHVVRTLPEAFLAVLSPEGQLERVLLLAFHEPPEYQASERWLAQFKGRDASSKGWRVGRDVHGLTGATLTAHAVTDAVRKVLALHAVVIRPREGG
jgi:uncharacterized SAM-binding protein YcdF (DUF218 family)